MKIVLVLLLSAAYASAAAAGGKQVSVDAPPARNVNTRTPPPGPAGRDKRAATCGTTTGLNAAQAEEVIKAHNLFRSREPSSNMLKVVWNDEMAAVAQAWANLCRWEHGMLYDCAGNRIGQNLFVEASAGGYPGMNLTYVTEAWYNERNDWNWNTASCAPGKLCGHWTQLVGARSYQVGCAFAQCPTMKVAGAVWENALFVVCDYTPPGNVIGEPIFLKGGACLYCDSERTGKGYRCENNLCVECSPATDASCKCGTPLACQNGGSWSASSCSCQCAKGFYGLGCERSCSCGDISSNCPFWLDYCPDQDYRDFMMENCKSTCNFSCDLPAACSA